MGRKFQPVTLTGDNTNILVPAGKRVSAVHVLDGGGAELVQVVLEDVPAKPISLLASAVPTRD